MNFFKIIISKIKFLKQQRRLKKKLRELKKRDPFIYK